MARILACLVAYSSSVFLAPSCYYSPKTRATKAHPSYMNEAEVEILVQRKLAPYGIKLIPNMKLRRDEVEFVADGYDRDMRIGYEYMSHEGMDFEGRPGQGPDGLTQAEIEVLQNRQHAFREYFLIIRESSREEVEKAIDEFIQNLYAWEVLKKKKSVEKQEALFPEEDSKPKDLLPWEATGDIRQKRKDMEVRESLDHKPGGGEMGEDEWGKDSGDTPKAKDDDWGDGSGDAKKKEKAKDKVEDYWGSDDDDEEDF